MELQIGSSNLELMQADFRFLKAEIGSSSVLQSKKPNNYSTLSTTFMSMMSLEDIV